MVSHIFVQGKSFQVVCARAERRIVNIYFKWLLFQWDSNREHCFVTKQINMKYKLVFKRQDV